MSVSRTCNLLATNSLSTVSLYFPRFIFSCSWSCRTIKLATNHRHGNTYHVFKVERLLSFRSFIFEKFYPKKCLRNFADVFRCFRINRCNSKEIWLLLKQYFILLGKKAKRFIKTLFISLSSLRALDEPILNQAQTL